MTISKKTTAVLFLSLFFGVVAPTWPNESPFEYQVVILQGLTAGGTIEKQSSGIFVDKKKTEALSALAEDGWEVVAVIGSGADDTVYLRRRRSK